MTGRGALWWWRQGKGIKMAVKQYVNLDPNIPEQLNGLDKLRAGRVIIFTAKLNKAVESIPILFEIVAGAKNVSASLPDWNFTRAEFRRIMKAGGGMDVGHRS